MPTSLTKNFFLEEFACHDGTPVPKKLLSNVKLLAKNLQVLRDELGVPVHVVSGYRTPSYNKKVGGVKLSQHLQGKAADVVVKGKLPAEVAVKINELIQAGKMKQGGLGLYAGFVHYDVRGRMARWVE